MSLSSRDANNRGRDYAVVCGIRKSSCSDRKEIRDEVATILLGNSPEPPQEDSPDIPVLVFREQVNFHGGS
jgi:hypothetical protein